MLQRKITIINNFKKVAITLLLSSLLIGLLGCSNQQEVDITKRSIVTAVGLDKAEDEHIELTLQIVNPSGLGVSEDVALASIEPIWINSTKGKTIFEATKRQLELISRRPYYNHVQVLVIGEELAKEGIKDLLDFFSRDSEARLSPKVIIAKETKAKNIVSAKSTMENIPAMHLRNILQNNESSGFIPSLTLFQVLKDMSSNIINVIIGGAEFKKDGKEDLIKHILVQNTAVFNRDKLVGWLDKLESKGLAYIKNQIHSIEIGIKDPLNEKNMLVIEQKNSQGKIDIKIEDKKPKAYINIKARGIIIEQFGETDLMTEDRLIEIEKEVENTIKENIRKVVYKAQKEFTSDILGVGDVIYRRYLKYWREIKSNWQEIFCNMPIEINVKFEIERTGLTGPPYTYH